jgi:hypothetical protein
MIIFNALVAFAIAFLILRKSGGIVRHLIAFVLAAPVAAILTVMAFEWAYPLGYSTARNQMMAYYFLGGRPRRRAGSHRRDAGRMVRALAPQQERRARTDERNMSGHASAGCSMR